MKLLALSLGLSLLLAAFAGCQTAPPLQANAPIVHATAMACDSTNHYPDVPRGDAYFEEMLGRY